MFQYVWPFCGDQALKGERGKLPLSWNTRFVAFHLVNPFVPNALFLYSLKTSENHRFPGVEKGCIGNELVTIVLKNFHLY